MQINLGLIQQGAEASSGDTGKLEDNIRTNLKKNTVWTFILDWSSSDKCPIMYLRNSTKPGYFLTSLADGWGRLEFQLLQIIKNTDVVYLI
jgi:hypothetical protein